MRLSGWLAPLLALGIQACGDPQRAAMTDNPAALAAVTEVVSKLKDTLPFNGDVSASLWDGTPIIVVETDDRGSGFESVVGIIRDHETVQSFGGELRLAFQTETEPPDLDHDPPFLGTKLILATFDAKTGRLIQ